MSSEKHAEPLAPQTNKEEEDGLLVNHLYKELIQRTCVDVACGMHRLFRTGPYDGFGSRSRQELYPDVYNEKNDDDVKEQLERYATVVPESHCLASVAEELVALGESDVVVVDEDVVMEGESLIPAAAAAVVPSPEPATMQLRNAQHDIWDKFPMKEDPTRLAECRICGRKVSTLRFAPHLDKCMNIGAGTTRVAATNAANTIQAAMRSNGGFK